MNWIESIYNLTTLWNLLHFDVVHVSNQTGIHPRFATHAYLAFDDFVGRKLDFSSIRPGNRNLLIFYQPLNELQFVSAFGKISVIYQNATISTSSVYHFVSWPKMTTPEDFCSQLKPLNATRSLTLASNVFVLNSDLNELVSIHEVYSVDKALLCRKLNTSDFLELTNKVGRRNDFQNVVLTATAAVQGNTASEISFVEDNNGRIVSATGSAVRIFHDLISMLNFSGNFTRGDWVMLNGKTQKLFGISVDQLRNGSAQLYLTQTTLSPYRAKEFNFLQPTFQDRLNAFFRQPPSSSVTDVHIAPFQTSLWLTVFATWTLLSLSVFTISCVKLDLEDDDSSIVNKMERLHEAVIWAIGAGCTQGWYRFPRSTSLRIVLLCGAVSGLVNFVTYSGAIISSLTSEVVPIRSLLDLLSSSLEIYFDEDSSTLRFIVQDLKNTSSRKDFVRSSVATGLSSIMQRPAALFGFTRNLYLEATKANLSANTLCSSISNVPIQKLPLQNGMLVTKWSPYREFFNYRIIQLKERGFNYRYSKTFMTETSIPCPPILHSYRENLGMLDVFTAFAILLGGTALAFLIFLMEKSMHLRALLNHYFRRKR